ncbi:MAG: M17 family peptidase N-terminal domain-containing protein [bacterium]
MIINVTSLPADLFPFDPLGVPLFQDMRPPRKEAGRVNFRLAGIISDWIEEGALDPASSKPVLFSPGQKNPFPMLVFAGCGESGELSAPATEKIVAAMIEAFLRAKTPAFGIAARDLKRPLSPPRDSAEVLLRGITHGAHMAGVSSGSAIRLHWERQEAELLIQELRRFRKHIEISRQWEIGPAPEDEEWIA